MRIPEEYKDLMDALVEGTATGRVNWHPYQNGIVVWFGDYGLHLWTGTDESDDPFLGGGLVDKEQVRGTLRDHFWIPDSGANSVYFDMYRRAERQVKGLDIIIKRMTDAAHQANPERKIGDPNPF